MEELLKDVGKDIEKEIDQMSRTQKVMWLVFVVAVIISLGYCAECLISQIFQEMVKFMNFLSKESITFPMQ